MFKIQPAPIPDHITEDGITLSKRPYPIIVDADGLTPEGGALDVVKVIGFVRDLSKQQVDLWWDDLMTLGDPIGMYVIIQNRAGGWATLSTAVETFEEI